MNNVKNNLQLMIFINSFDVQFSNRGLSIKLQKDTFYQKIIFLFFLIFFCLNISCFAELSGISNKEKGPVWAELLGSWNISNQTLSPNLKKAGTDFQNVLSKSDMEAASRWSEISVNFQIDDSISQYSAGFALNIKDSSDFGILRICNISNQSFLQVGWWKYGYYRPYLNLELKKNIHPGEWYNISVHPTMGIKEWRPWTITLKSCQNGQILFEQGIENGMPLFGRGGTGLYAKGGKVSFKDFQIHSDFHFSSHRYLKLAPLFTDGMVIQRNMLVPVWGLTKPGEMVQVKVNNHVFTTSSDSLGHWRIDLTPMNASNSISILVVSAKDSILLHNIAVGEVWLASGQSNMQMKVWQSDIDSLARTLPPDLEIRMFMQPQWPSDTPVFDSGGKWEYAESGNTKNWSAVAYGFALQLHKRLKVPVGIICSYWGGTAAESWFPREELDKDTITKPILESYNRAQTALENRMAPVNIHPWNVPGQSHAPGYLYNGMIHPHVPAAIRGVIWYQGESNAERAKQYEVLFPMLIRSWRQLWSHPDMYFFFVQLPGFDGNQSGSNIESAWPQLRDAQRKTLQKLYNVGMAVTLDIGDSTNIHPIHKREVAERLARWALHDAYLFLNIVRSGPLFKSVKFKDQVAIVDFTETASGLKVRNGNILRGFTVAGADQKFFPANAKINADRKSISVWSEKIKHPVAVRYAWENYPSQVNLVNSDDLPASSFRTDSWPLPTDENR